MHLRWFLGLGLALAVAPVFACRDSLRGAAIPLSEISVPAHTPGQFEYSPDGNWLLVPNAQRGFSAWSVPDLRSSKEANLPRAVYEGSLRVDGFLFHQGIGDRMVIALQSGGFEVWDRRAGSGDEREPFPYVLTFSRPPQTGLVIPDQVLQTCSQCRILGIPLANDQGHRLKFWDLNNRTPVRGLKFRGNHTAISPDGKLYAVGGHKLPTRVYSVGDNQRIAAISGGDGAYRLSFSPDGTYLVVVTHQYEMHMYSTVNFSRRITLSSHGAIRSVVFSPRSNYFAVQEWSKRLRVFNRMGREVAALQHREVVQEPTFSEDGSVIATYDVSQSDPLVTLWSIPEGKSLMKIPGFISLSTLRFSPDGTSMTLHSERTGQMRVVNFARYRARLAETN